MITLWHVALGGEFTGHGVDSSYKGLVMWNYFAVLHVVSEEKLNTSEQ